MGLQGAEEGDRHARDRSLERRVAGGVVDHDHRDGTRRLAVRGAVHAGADAAHAHHDLAGRPGVLGRIAAEADPAGSVREDEDRRGAHGQRPVVVVGQDDAVNVDAGGGQGRERGVDRGDAEGAAGDTRRTGEVGARAVVPGRGDDHDAGQRCVVRGDRVDVGVPAERGAERHVDDVDAVDDGLVDRRHHDVIGGRPLAAEDSVGPQRRLRGDARTDQEGVAAERSAVVGSAERRSARQDPDAGGGAGDVRAVAVAVEGIGVGLRRVDRRVIGTRVVGVAHEVGAAGHLGVGERGSADGQSVVGREVGWVARASEVGVVVVDPGVDDADGDAGARGAEILPGGRRADVLDAPLVIQVDLLHGVHGAHASQVREGPDLRCGDADRHPIVGVLELAENATAGRGDARLELVLTRSERGADRLAFRLRELAALPERLPLPYRDRLGGELEDDAHLPVRAEGDRHELQPEAADVDPLEARRRLGGRRRGKHRRAQQGGDGDKHQETSFHDTPLQAMPTSPLRSAAPTAAFLRHGSGRPAAMTRHTGPRRASPGTMAGKYYRARCASTRLRPGRRPAPR